MMSFSKPRVCVLTTSYPDFPGSYRGIFVWRAVQGLIERGYKISVVTPRLFRKSKGFEDNGDERIYRFPFLSEEKLLVEYDKVPVWRMIATGLMEIERRARRWRRSLRQAGVAAEIVDGESTVGGGSLPGETLPTKLVALAVPHPDQLAAALRAADPPVVARIEEDRLVLDPRTVLVEEEKELLRAVKEATAD